MSTGIQTGQNADPRNFTGMIFMYGGASAPTGFLLCDGAAVSRSTYSDLFGVLGTAYGDGDGSTTFNVPDLRSSFPLGLGQKTKILTFEDADVDTATDEITVSSNQYLQTGQAVDLSNSGGALPTGLSATTYYVIRVNATTIKLATSRGNADDDAAVDITAASGGGTHTVTLTLTDRLLGDEGGEENHTITTSELPSHTHGAKTPDGASQTQLDRASSGNNQFDNNFIEDTGGDQPHNNMPPYVAVNYIIKT